MHGTEIKVGLFVLVALGAFALLAFNLGGFNLHRTETYTIVTIFPSAAGLKPGVGVELAGIRVGRVAQIELYDNNQARVGMEVQDGIRLPADSVAYIRTSGILGDKYVELAPGQSLEKLDSGDQITPAKTAADISDVLEQLSDIATDIKTITQPLAEANTGGDIKEMVASLKLTSQTVERLVLSNEGGLTESLQSFHTTMASLKEITDKINAGQGTLGQLINDDRSLNELNSTLASLRNITNKIDSGEGTIGRLVNDDETIEKIDSALSSINGYFEKESQFKVFVDYRADYLTEHDFMKSTVNVRLQPAPDHYYLLGVTGDYFGQYQRSDYRYTDASGKITTSTKEEWERGELKFNAQIAKRYYDFVLRGGLFESEPGVGVDYLLDEDKMRITFEAFSGDFDENPHLRAELSYNFWKIFYASIGYDDFISEENRASPYFGIGLRFNDDDLKYIISNIATVI